MQNQENTAPEADKEEVKEEKVEQPTADTETQEEAPQMRTDEIVEVEWEDVEQLYRINTYSKQVESQLADVCLRYEKAKQTLLSRLSECETFLFNSGTSLKDSHGIDPNLTYELKLPKQEGEKAFFLRKDA